jgi:poly-gamma-glutamate synthesis protein (capsule biosynthesis protein)
VGFLSFTDNEEGCQATPSSAGVLYAPIEPEDGRTTALFDVIRDVRAHVDFLIVAAHWGTNWGSEPPMAHQAFARRLIEAGADLIFGHSAHVCRGIEIYNQRPILYSTGDFIDDYAISPLDRNDRSFLFFVELEERRVRTIRLVPTLIRECRAQIARGPEAEESSANMMRLCSALGSEVVLDRDRNSTILVS